MDLIAKYLIIIIIFFSINLGLVLNSYNNKKRKVFPIIYTIILFILSTSSIEFLKSSNNINQYFNIIILLIVVIILVITYYYEKQELNKRDINEISLTILSISEYILMMILISSINISQETLIYGKDSLLNGLLITVLSLIIILVIKRLTKPLKEKLEKYENSVGEYMIVESILFFIIGLTYNTVKSLDYSMFDPFMTLTPTYQVVSVIIGLCILIVLGTYIKTD